MARLIRASEPAIVHAHYLTSFGLMATLALKLAYPLRSKSALVQSVWEVTSWSLPGTHGSIDSWRWSAFEPPRS